MAIQTQFQTEDFGFNNNNNHHHQFYLNLQQEELILLQQKYPEKFSQVFLHQQHQQELNLSQNLDSHTVLVMDEIHRQEMDHFLKLQSERLRLVLHEKTNQQIGSLLNNIDTKTRVLFRQKDEEIAMAKKRRRELEQFLTRLQIENQERQKTVQENEAMVISLTNSLEQVREKLSSSCFNNGVDINEAESSNRDNETDVNRRKKRRMICGICKCRISVVVFLPCRHLCACKSCENVVDSCPICNTMKKATIDVVIF